MGKRYPLPVATYFRDILTLNAQPQRRLLHVVVRRLRKKRNEALWTSVERLSQSNENAFRTANVTEEVYVFVLHYLPNEFRTMGLQAGKDFFNVLNGEDDTTFGAGTKPNGAEINRRQFTRNKKYPVCRGIAS
jgi:hypothetical protein